MLVDGGARKTARPDTHAAACTAASWRATGSGSSLRPPGCQRESILQTMDLGLQQLVVHRQIPHLRFPGGRSVHPAHHGYGCAELTHLHPGTARATHSAWLPSHPTPGTGPPGPPHAAGATPPSCFRRAENRPTRTPFFCLVISNTPFRSIWTL